MARLGQPQGGGEPDDPATDDRHPTHAGILPHGAPLAWRPWSGSTPTPSPATCSRLRCHRAWGGPVTRRPPPPRWRAPRPRSAASPPVPPACPSCRPGSRCAGRAPASSAGGRRSPEAVVAPRSPTSPTGDVQGRRSATPKPRSSSWAWPRPPTGPTARAACSPATPPATSCMARCTAPVTRRCPRPSRSGDGQALTGIRIVAAVRCAPPKNAPTAAEKETCSAWLRRDLELAAPRLRAILCLGAIGWGAAVAAARGLGWTVPSPRPRFGHAAEVPLHDAGGARHPARRLLPRQPAQHLHRSAHPRDARRRAAISARWWRRRTVSGPRPPRRLASPHDPARASTRPLPPELPGGARRVRRGETRRGRCLGGARGRQGLCRDQLHARRDGHAGRLRALRALAARQLA